MDDALARLPSSGERRLAVRVTKDALRQIRGGHPWVFESSITSCPDGGRAGDLAVIFDGERRFQGIGLYDPASPIRVRMLHHGPPVPIDDVWWRQRFADALARLPSPGERRLAVRVTKDALRQIRGGHPLSLIHI